MHSFTYDYHLRMVHQVAAGKPALRKGYHLVHFLDDFRMYYNKGPNFALNTVQSGSVDITCSSEWVNTSQLYNYVLSHEAVYHFKVVRMEPLYVESMAEEPLDLDYALVRHTKYKLSFSFPDHLRRKSDDYDVTLVVCHDMKAVVPSNILRLKYYIVLTSLKDIYPAATQGNVNSTGVFRTVSTGITAWRTCSPPFITSPNVSPEVVEATPDEEPSTQREPPPPQGGPQHPQNLQDIKTEAVNYVGYFSTHEQSMQSVMQIQASTTEAELLGTFKEATVHCRRDQLWKSLHDNNIEYDGFSQLLKLVAVEPLGHSREFDQILRGRSLSWFKGLSKLLMLKYEKNHRILAADNDCMIEHVVVLSDHFMDMATLITLNLRTGEAEFSVINRLGRLSPEEIRRRTHNIAEKFVNNVCFHFWQEQFFHQHH
jgi:hypothetical protein